MLLRQGNGDYSMRIAAIKARFTKYYLLSGHCELYEKRIHQNKGERAIWQQSLWEHMILDDDDYLKHVDFLQMSIVH